MLEFELPKPQLGQLEKLRSLDPKTFGLPNHQMDKAQATSLLQLPGPMDAEDRLAKLGPILDKMKGDDAFDFIEKERRSRAL